MVKKQAVFNYKTVKGPLHKLPAIFKLFILIILSLLCIKLPSLWLFIGILLTILLSFFCKLTLKEQLIDFKPAAFYVILMFSLSIFSNLIDNRSNLLSFNASLLSIFIPYPDFLRIVLRLILIIQLSALFFRTTSLFEIREGLLFFGKKSKLYLSFTESISLFLCFIPEIFQIWSSIDLSWKARGGKPGFKKIKNLLFILITLSFERASLKARAIEARR